MLHRKSLTLLLASTLLAGLAGTARAEVHVVASIKPVHSLVAAVMEGVGEPGLIIEGAGSPHTYALKPSQAQMLEQADLIFWVGHELEAFLEKPLETIGAKAKTVELLDAPGLVKLGFREGGAFEPHHHGGEAGEQEGEAGHDHDAHETHESGHDHPEAEHDHEAGHDHDHAHGAFDAHVWLDPVNAKAMVGEIETALVEADPDNGARYHANAEAVRARLDALNQEVAQQIEPVRGKGFVVFHDGYQYFEHRFDIPASGSITVSPEVLPGAERIAEIRTRVKELGAACVFAEPQFEPKLVATVLEGTQARSGVLDPLGAGLEPGPGLYFELIRAMSTSLTTCLSQDG
ncbi:zinc ABC transporter substrate-binding protein ZnuA [Hoeflea olei]|uniref:High-affinity zinc uptake system protein ZnuA n=1 Tax=Hoeflea olei TaxID=1480615 RepID=A0A1C1YTZ2_9HYPH|nr:zinc ABC transporter substrate-binding protein ZnuA [Hoeflea olei]OCW56979.1 zinc transporter [Hoeflea olei]